MAKHGLRLLVALLLPLGLALGCAYQQRQVELGLEQPPVVNCATAGGDLRVLQHEKADVAQRIADIQAKCDVEE